MRIKRRTIGAQPGFRDDLYRARKVRGDWAFGEQILDIADNAANDWSYNEKSGKLSVNKELVLRSKLRIEARQFHMSRLHPQQWGDRQQIDIKDDWSMLTEDERRRKAEELIAMIEEIKNPPPPAAAAGLPMARARRRRRPTTAGDRMGTSTSYWTGRLRRLAGITTVTSADADSWTPCGVDCADRDGLVRKGEVPSHPRPIFRGAPRIWGPLHLCHATKCSRTRLLNNDSTIITSDHIEPHSCFPRFGSSG